MGGVIIILVVVVPLLFFFCYQRFQLLLLHFLHMHGRPLLPPRPLISYVYFLLVRFFFLPTSVGQRDKIVVSCFAFVSFSSASICPVFQFAVVSVAVAAKICKLHENLAFYSPTPPHPSLAIPSLSNEISLTLRWP